MGGRSKREAALILIRYYKFDIDTTETVGTKNTPWKKVRQTELYHGVFSCVKFCLRLVGPLEKCGYEPSIKKSNDYSKLFKCKLPLLTRYDSFLLVSHVLVVPFDLPHDELVKVGWQEKICSYHFFPIYFFHTTKKLEDSWKAKRILSWAYLIPWHLSPSIPTFLTSKWLSQTVGWLSHLIDNQIQCSALWMTL